MLSIASGTTALTKDGQPLQQITVDEVCFDIPAPPTGAYAISCTYGYGPDGATFTLPITMTLKYDPGVIPSGVAEADLKIAYYDVTTSKWVVLPSTVDTLNNTISAQVSHFTLFAVYAAAPTSSPTAIPTPTPTPTRAPTLTLTPTSGLAGSFVSISGSGWTAWDNVGLSFDGASWLSTTADAIGQIATAVQIPPAATPGVKLVAGADGYGAFCSTTFTVLSTPTPTPTLTITTTPSSAVPSCTVSSPVGTVQVQKNGSASWTNAAAGTKLEAGDRLKTGSNGSAVLLFFDGSVMEVKASSEILVDELSTASTGSTAVSLKELVGSTINRVGKLVDSSSKYEVETPAAAAVVRGTTFDLLVQPNGDTTVKSEQGSVSFTAAGVTVTVNQGFQSSAVVGGSPSTPIAFATSTSTATPLTMTKEEFLQKVREKCPQGIDYDSMVDADHSYREWCNPAIRGRFALFRIDGPQREYENEDRIILLIFSWPQISTICSNPPGLDACVYFQNIEATKTYTEFPMEACLEALNKLPCLTIPTPTPTPIGVTIGPGLANSPWPMFGHDPQHTGRSPYSGPSSPELKWSYTTRKGIDSSPAIGSDGTIYVGSHDGKLYAIEAIGTLRWTYNIGADVFIGSTPAVASDGTIFVGSADSSLYAINSNGTLKWSYKTGGTVYASPSIGSDGTIFVGSNDGKLYAINPDGTLKWGYQTGDWIDSTAAIGSDGTIFVGSADSRLYAINSNGTLKWSYTTGGVVRSSPAIGSDSTIYVGSWDNKLYAINPDGSLRWSFTTQGSISSSPSIGSDGTIYVSSFDTKLYAINSNGTLRWSYTIANVKPTVSYWMDSSPTIGADGTIYVGSSDGTLKWSYATGLLIVSSPAIGADGTIYVGSQNYKFYAIGGTAAPMAPTGTATNNNIYIYTGVSIFALGVVVAVSMVTLRYWRVKRLERERFEEQKAEIIAMIEDALKAEGGDGK